MGGTLLLLKTPTPGLPRQGQEGRNRLLCQQQNPQQQHQHQHKQVERQVDPVRVEKNRHQPFVVIGQPGPCHRQSKQANQPQRHTHGLPPRCRCGERCERCVKARCFSLLHLLLHLLKQLQQLLGFA